MLEQLNDTVTVLKAVEFILGVLIVPLIVAMGSLINGVRCLLRSDMMHTYYKNKDSEKIRQYELENFIHLYKAYKALRGNSFVDKINNEVMNWEVTT